MRERLPCLEDAANVNVAGFARSRTFRGDPPRPSPRPQILHSCHPSRRREVTDAAVQVQGELTADVFFVGGDAVAAMIPGPKKTPRHLSPSRRLPVASASIALPRR